MNNIENQYLNLLQDILDNGNKKSDRTGTGTLSVFGRQIRHQMKEGFPLLTTKKMAWKGIVHELIWFLRGETNIKYLVDNDCHIWDGDAYKNYLKFEKESFDRWIKSNSEIVAKFSPMTKEQFSERIKTDPKFAEEYGELGPIYGKQWRNWQGYDQGFGVGWDTVCSLEYGGSVDTQGGIDQISQILDLLKNNPDSRRIIVSAWNPGELDKMVLPPCHYSFQLYTRELKLTERLALAYKKLMSGHTVAIEMQKDGPIMNFGFNPMDYATHESIEPLNIPKRAVSLMWNQRSVDTFLGLPFNIASYGLLLEIIAKECNMMPDELIGNLGDTHIYMNHLDQVKEQLKRDTYKLPQLDIKLHFENSPSFVPEHWLVDDFQITNYKSHPSIKAPLSN